MKFPRLRILTLALTLGLPFAAAAHAQNTVVGIRATVTAVDPGTATADLDVTQYTSPALGTPGSVGFIGDQYSATSVFGPYVYTFVFRANTPDINAIEYGDAVTLDQATLPLAAAGTPNTFRGSFSHVYPGPGAYTARVGTFTFGGYPDDGPYPGYDNPKDPLITGNRVPVTGAVNLDYLVYMTGAPVFSTTINFIPAYPSFAANFTNTVQVVVSQSILEIPTQSELGLGILALLLAGTAVVLMRR